MRTLVNSQLHRKHAELWKIYSFGIFCFLNMMFPIPFPTAERGEVFAHASGWDLNPSCPYTWSAHLTAPAAQRRAGTESLGVLQTRHPDQSPSGWHWTTAQLSAEPSWVAAQGTPPQDAANIRQVLQGAWCYPSWHNSTPFSSQINAIKCKHINLLIQSICTATGYNSKVSRA